MYLLKSICDKCYIGYNYLISMKKILFRKLLIDCLVFFFNMLDISECDYLGIPSCKLSRLND